MTAHYEDIYNCIRYNNAKITPREFVPWEKDELFKLFRILDNHDFKPKYIYTPSFVNLINITVQIRVDTLNSILSFEKLALNNIVCKGTSIYFYSLYKLDNKYSVQYAISYY